MPFSDASSCRICWASAASSGVLSPTRAALHHTQEGPVHQLTPTEHMGSYSRFVCKHSKCVLVGVAINMSRHAPQASFHRAILPWSAITKRRTSVHGCCGSVVSRCYDIRVNRGTSEA